jgi:ubiquinone/menaquinone biosynthesis C-methylase UbiE
MHFDKQAATWDNDPIKIERAKVFAHEISNFIQPNQKLSALEVGCGTGLLSFELKDAFKHITLTDTSEGMINVLKEKIQSSGINNFTPLLADLLTDGPKIPKHDVIYTSMTLHHILDLDAAFKAFNAILEIDGYLCIADLEKEDGTFHAGMEGFHGHHGFEREKLEGQLLQHNFEAVYYNPCFELERKVGDTTRKFPLFMMICRKTKDIV